MTGPIPHGWYIRDRDSFNTLCAHLKRVRRIGLDTEFIGENRFSPCLELIQIAFGDTCAVVDVPAVGSLDGLGDILVDPTIEKVVHAGRQDLELLAAHTGQVPTPCFDTQIAASMVGYGPQIAYSQLVWQVTGRKLEKAYTYTDWSHRPLTSEQLAYAIEDVQFLFPLHDHLLRRLQSLGRLEWAQEEFARLQASIGVTATDPRERYRRIRGWENLKPQQAAVLRELAVWRDAVAQRRNLPRGRVMRDEVLIELARKSPRTIEGMKGTRGLTRSDIEKWGEAILAAIQRGLATPPSDLPAVSPVRRPRADSAGLVELLQAVLKARAFDQDIAPTLLATAADLQELVEAGPEREARNLPILHGWRRTLAGELLLHVLEGKVSISVDRQRKKLILTPHP